MQINSVNSYNCCPNGTKKNNNNKKGKGKAKNSAGSDNGIGGSEPMDSETMKEIEQLMKD